MRPAFDRQWPAFARLLRVAVAALICLVAAATTPSLAATTRAPLEPGLVAVLSDAGDLYLQALPERGEARQHFTRRLSDSPTAWEEIARANRGASRLLAGVRYLVPFRVLRGELQLRVVRELFPHDRAEASGWRHVVARLGKGRAPKLEKIAEWFTGDADHARKLREVNHLDRREPRAGSELVVPAELLSAPFRGLLPEAKVAGAPRAPEAPATAAANPATPVATASPVASSGAVATPASPESTWPAPVEGGPLLEYGQDEKGAYAVYRLRAKEALYSAVVVRFTGQLQAEDVIALAGEIAQRSGIADVTDIPIGYPVKIPRELLLPEYLPSDDPERKRYEADLTETARYRNQVTAKVLEGITVILDAGHGGADVGASMDGTWESLYVYDIVLRIKALLEKRTLAKVYATTSDGEGDAPPDVDILPARRSHRVLTTPPYRIEDSVVGVHLRWYLANNLYRKAVAASGGAGDLKSEERVVFLSVHADSLHPSLRGATVYIPAAERTGGSFQKGGPVFSSRLEVRDQPAVEFSRRDRVRSEGLSRQVGGRLVDAFRAANLAVHPYKPVRDRIIRNRRAWVPAVLRYNAIPAKVLLEVCNLANSEDRRLLRTRAFRQQVAESVASALLAYYGETQAALAPAADPRPGS
ncbi:MAG: N-acetylmuramoyl-L-alanine amidase [Holophagales bacterium]|nr:MAG: N-acetylmuramoyl-L-alanine amidase [Holophagales bacterium]